LRKLLNTEIPTWNINASIDDITTTIEQEQKLSGAVLKNDAPVIFYKEVANYARAYGWRTQPERRQRAQNETGN